MDSKWGGGGGASSGSGFSSTTHRLSLRPGGGSTSPGLASRYGLTSTGTSASRSNGAASSSSSSSGAATGMGANISSSVASFMRKVPWFAGKASTTNSIDSSFKQYQKELQQQQAKQTTSGGASGSASGYASTSAGPVFASVSSGASAGLSSSQTAQTSATAAAFPLSHHSDTGYSSNANSPATTPTVSSISASPIPPAQLSSSFTSPYGSSSNVDGAGGSRPSSAASSTTASTQRGPLFSKIRAKMASTFSGQPQSAVESPLGSGPPTPIPSLLQSNAPSSSISAHLSTLARPDSVSSTFTSTLDAQQRQQRSSSITSQTGGANFTGPNTSPGSGDGSGSQRPPMLSMLSQSHSSSLTNEQLTAHLTEEEKKILEKVFQKEEEFREIALKNFVKSTTMTEGSSNTASASQPNTSNLLPTGSPVSGVSHLSTNLLDPVAAAVHRRRSSAIMSADATGFCRICRKVIMKDEASHRCSNCQELVCDDCSSYSSREESKYWMCSFCRRRGSHLILTTTTTSDTSTTTSTMASSLFSTLTATASSLIPSISAAPPSQSQPSISINVPKSPQPSPPPPARSTTTSTPQQPPPSPHPLLSATTSATLQPSSATTTAKRKSSFSECQIRQHDAISNQRQSSLDLQKTQILLQQRKSAQFAQSPLLYQAAQTAQAQAQQTQQQQAAQQAQWNEPSNKMPRVELPPPEETKQHAQPALGEAHPSAYYSTSVNQGATMIQQSPTSNVHQLAPTPTCSNMTSPSLTSATSTTTPTTIALSPQNGNARTRIYSLSDDEELLSDDEDDDEEDDDEDEDFDNDEDDEEEEELFEEDAEEYGKDEFSRRLKQHRKTHHRKFSLQKASPIPKETTLDEIAEIPFEKCLPSKRSRKRPKQNGKSHHKGGLSPHKDDYEAYVHMIGGPSHGTLASVPAETLKRRRSSKRKKKKASHHGASYNSDDELMTTSAGVKQQQEQDQQEIAQYMNNNGGQGMFGPGRRDSGAGLLQQPLPMIPHGNLTTFADVVNTVTSGSLLHQRASFSGFSGAQPFAGLQRMGSGYYGTGKPLSAMQQMHRPSQAVASKWWRLSKKVGSMSRTGQIGLHDSAIFNYGVGLRQRKSSESSDVSDVRYSPPQDSLTPSSEYSRSPRESADSEMLGLTYSGLAMQRRSIPSVLVDVGGDGLPMGCQPSGYFLSLKDCYNRRGSAGRALPQIPVEPSRSMLDLPHSRKSSAHSLDIPMEQPRRASAPEGENIRIVIDEVQDVTGSHPELLTQGGSCDPDSERTYSRSGSARASSGAIVPLQPTVITQVQVAPQGQTSYQQRMRAQLTRAASIVTHYERVILKREDSDLSNRTRGFGLSVIGGRLNEQDGMLYAYVNWSKPGGQADKQGLKPGDKILEWNSKSLVNCSYEQVCNIIDTSGESAELIVESMVKCDPALQKQRRRESLAAQQAAIAAAAAASGQQLPPTSASATHSTHHQEKLRPSSAAATLVPTSTSPTPPRSAREAREIREDREERTGSGGSSASATPRRRLPAIPKSPKSASTATYLAEASILLQVTMDTNIRQLSVVIVSAKGLDQHPLYQTGLSGNIPPNEAYAQLRLLPEMGFKVCQTELNFNFEWNETLIYHQFPLERVDEITLDLSVWTTNSTSMAPFYQHHHNIPTPSPQIRVRSPRHSSVGLPVAPQISITSDHSSTYQLASTRIPLRSALFQLSEWWPLIPTEVNYVQGPPPTVVVPAPLDLSGSGGSSGMSVPSPAPNMPSTAPPVFFHKAPSMDYIDISSGNLLGDTIMMSRSTPGSRRNSGRSESGMEMIIEASPCTEQAGTQPGNAHGTTTTTMSSRPIVSSGYQRPPTRGSTATLSSSTGRHSLDDSSYSNSVGGGPKSGEGGGSLSLGRSTSLRLVQNRHSVGNVYNMPSTGDSSVLIATAYTRGPHLAAPNQDYERRKSSSALGQSATKISSHLAPGGVPAFVGGYSRFTGDSTQFLLMSQQQLGPGQSAQQISSQETSPLSSDDDIDNLLLEDSNLESDSTPNRPSVPFPNYRPQSSASMMSSSQQQQSQLPESAKKHSDPKLNQLTVIDSNKLSIASIDDPSRYSGTASPVTPSNEDEPDEGSGSLSSQNLLAPNWASTGRRKSFLQRLMPAGVSAGAAALLHKDHDQSFSSSEHAQTKSVVVGEIKLGFIMTKGFLEIEVIAARGLPDSVTGPYAPDTYVKTYVYDRGRQLYKRKTRVVAGDKSPQYRQTLKYDANIIYGRSILVSVWEKQKRTFEPNVPIGATEINVNQLELHKLTIRWYRLRSFVSPSSDHGGMGAGEGPMGSVGTSAPSTSAQETSGSQQQPTSELQHQQHPQRSMLPSV